MKNKKSKKSKTTKKQKQTKSRYKLSKSFINICKKNLLLKYKELVGISKKNIDLFENIGDEADIALNVLEQEISQELSDTQITLINLILDALEKIKKGTYGICEKCGVLIDKKRLQALPWAKYCINCQNNIEK